MLLKDIIKFPVVMTVRRDSFKFKDRYGYKLKSPAFESEKVILIAAKSAGGLLYITYTESPNTHDYRSGYFPTDFEAEVSTDDLLIAQHEKYTKDNWNYRAMVPPKDMSLGSDPEMFVEDKNGEMIPAFKFLGSKTEGKHTTSKPRDGAQGNVNESVGNKPVYWDGFQAEFETYASTCIAWQVDSVQCGLRGLLNAARKFNPEAKLSMKSTVVVDAEVLANTAEKHVQFGCMPSFNAYGMKGEALDGRATPYRSSGGHIHFGMTFKDDAQKVACVKTLDKILGVLCVGLFANMDNAVRRRSYGLAGEYRTPKHGLEYRTLTNAWMCHPLIMNIVFELARICVQLTVAGNQDKVWNATKEETIACINNCDVALAKKIIKRNEKFVHIVFSNRFGLPQTACDRILNAFLEGVETLVENVNDLENNWNLTSTWAGHCEGKNKNVRNSSDTLQAKRKVS